jgi:hypothetical protein
MSGIRVQHPTAHSCRYTIVDSTVPYPVPYTCTSPALGGCGSTHLFKTHHLNLDETGAAIVSPGVFERVKGRLAADGFVVTNEVKKPPTLGIGLAPPESSGPKSGAWGNVPIVRSPGNPS